MNGDKDSAVVQSIPCCYANRWLIPLTNLKFPFITIFLICHSLSHFPPFLSRKWPLCTMIYKKK